MKDDRSSKKNPDRRKFLKLGVMSGITGLTGATLLSQLASEEELKASGDKVRLLTPDGKMVEVDAENINKYPEAPNCTAS